MRSILAFIWMINNDFDCLIRIIFSNYSTIINYYFLHYFFLPFFFLAIFAPDILASFKLAAIACLAGCPLASISFMFFPIVAREVPFFSGISITPLCNFL